MDLSNSSAIVTGAGSGLGAATARILAPRVASVVVVDRHEENGQKVAAEIDGTFVLADVADEHQVMAAVDAALAAAPLRVLVNCAGVGSARRIVDREGAPIPLKYFEKVLRVNLVGSYNCARLAAAAMVHSEPDADGARGAILHTASVAAFEGQIGQTAYAASKGGIVGMTLPMARDLAAYGIRVNTLAPGLIDTPIYGSGAEADDLKAKLSAGVVFPRRLGLAEEYASLAIEVLTNGYMNGEVIRLDGAIRMAPQ
jgi:NAD(P)-dependent dehydrogenase (short-subunit alcohol dehydrogenase family)